MTGTLYLTGTPIGNLSDLSPRALETLRRCDFIAAEDTRVTLKLLNHFEIKKPLLSYHEHNRKERGEVIMDRLLKGENCALVTDAGMPAISDPGQELVDLCHSRGVRVEAVPGPTALTSALALSGLPAGRFVFEGFLSVDRAGRRARLQSLAGEERTLVFYEAPHKLAAALKDLYAYLGDRRVALVKEITKLHERVERTTLGEAAERYSQEPVRGEYVLVVEGAPAVREPELSSSEAAELARELMRGGVSLNEAAKQTAKRTGLKKSDIYRLLTER